MRLGALILGVLFALPAAAETPPEAHGYRMEDYSAPVPATLEGATVVDVDAAHALWKTGRVAFIDVLPRRPKPENLPPDAVFREDPHQSIPGATWLPNVGYGEIADETAAYFQSGLEYITGNDATVPLVFFCLTDCWMSWNAAKRVQEWGYDNVFWFPMGTDGWASEGYPTATTDPFEP